MRNKCLLIAAAFATLMLGVPAHAAPGGNQAGGKPKMEQPAKSTERAQTKTREQVEASNPGTGKQVREQSEETRQVGQDAAGQGQATSAEMQQRKEERKEIQEQYRTGEQSGDRSGKKPWWKFWDSDAGA